MEQIPDLTRSACSSGMTKSFLGQPPERQQSIELRTWCGRGRDGDYHACMSKLLLNLREVPGDEAADVRALLDAKHIAYYETPPNFWGISSGGIWVAQDADFADAKRTLDDYERRRSERVRAEYAAAKHEGTAETFIDILRSNPMRVALALLGILIALGLVALPVILLRG
jgi:hypothetical protein